MAVCVELCCVFVVGFVGDYEDIGGAALTDPFAHLQPILHLQELIHLLQLSLHLHLHILYTLYSITITNK